MRSARIGDYISIICPHGAIGAIVAGSPDVIDNNIPTSRLSDATVCLICGCSGQIISGSPDVIVNNLQTARVGDTTEGICDIGKKCCPHSRIGTICSGSPDIDIDG